MAEKNFLEAALAGCPVLWEQFKTGLSATELEAELGLAGMKETAAEAIALAGNLDTDGLLRVMFLLAERLIPEETRTAPAPADRACVQLLKTACYLPPGHLVMLIRDLVFYELLRRRGSSAP